MREKLTNFLNSAKGRLLVVVGMVASSLGIAAPAFASGSYTPASASTAVTSFAGTTFASVAPMILAVAGALIGIVLLVWGVRTVLHKVRGVSI